MANQTFDVNQARSIAKTIKTKGTNARDIINQLDRDIKSVEAWWKGESSQAFVEEFNQLKPNLDKLVECVNNISVQVDKVAQIKEQSERDIANALRR